MNYWNIYRHGKFICQLKQQEDEVADTPTQFKALLIERYDFEDDIEAYRVFSTD